MATRSGKPYNHDTETPRRRQMSIKESTVEKLKTNGKEVESNLNNSNMSSREMRGKKPRVKDNVETSDVAKTDAGLATETNWIISAVSTKGKRKTTVKAVDKINVEDTENDINISNVTTKQLRRRSRADSTVDTKVVNTTEKDTGNDIETTNGNDNKEDNDAEVASKQLKKKKKAKGGKKKKQKGKSSTEVAEDTTEMIDNIIKNKRSSNEDLDRESIKSKKKKLRSKKSRINSTGLEKEDINDKEERNNSIVTSNVVENDVSLNSSSRRLTRKRKSVTQDTTFEKNNVSMNNKNDKTSSNINNEKELDLNTSNVSNKNLRNKKSLARDTTFEKDDNISIDIKKDKTLSNNSVEKEIDFNSSNISNKNLRSRKSLPQNTTFDKETTINCTANKNNISKELNLTNTSNKSTRSRKSIVDTTFEKDKDTTYEKVDTKDQTFDKSVAEDMLPRNNDKQSVNTTYDKKETYDKDHASFDSFKKGANTRKSSIQDVSFNKRISIHSLTKDELSKDNVLSSSLRKSLRRQTIDCSYLGTPKLDCVTSEPKRKSHRLSAATEHILNTTFEKEPIEKQSKSSLISSDNSSDKSEISRISITSDDTEEIINTTPVLIESSMNESVIGSPQKQPTAQTPLKREGTFTKDAPEVLPLTPSKQVLTPMAGCTPYHVGRSSQKKPLMNVTRSIEKRLSVDPAPRMTRVMFCSPIDNPTVCQDKRKVIKSNLKGSNKSFVFDDSAVLLRPARKRSYTHNDADDARVKRSRLAEDLQQSVDRLSRPRTNTTAKNNETTPKKPATPFKSQSETKSVRTRLPNFAALHQKQFDKMESLDECQERKAKRARKMLTPNGATKMLERISPKNNTELQKPTNEQIAPKDQPKDKPDTPSKKFTLESLRPGFTRFGFKLNLDINPFTIATKTDKVIKPNVLKKGQPNGLVLRQGVFPSLAGTTFSRRDIAKQTVMREKGSLEKKRNMTRNENRTIIKGVRTNRRFELQMKLRNIE